MKPMTEDEFRRKDLTIKAVAPIVTVIGFLFGIGQFVAAERNKTEREYALIAANDLIEFKRRTWDEQLTTYRKLATVVGEVASAAGDRPRFAKAVREFDVMYWGVMAFVQDRQVEEALKAFHLEIRDVQRDPTRADQLKVRANMLVEATRASLTRSWNELGKAR